jgi:hypothetical protein
MNTKNRNSSYRPTGKTNYKALLWVTAIIAAGVFAAVSATENYSEGERIGFITRFSSKGRFWKSWEGELNLTQTGMNTSSVFHFSIDNDQQQDDVVKMIDSAVNNGWKVKLTYHETYCKNWFRNRGETDYFINDIKILDRSTIGTNAAEPEQRQGRIIDTVFVVLDKAELLNRKQ